VYVGGMKVDRADAEKGRSRYITNIPYYHTLPWQ